MKSHVDGISRSCFYQLRQLRSIRRSVPTDALHTLVQAFIASHIDSLTTATLSCTGSPTRSFIDYRQCFTPWHNWSLASGGTTTSCGTHFTGYPCLSTLPSKLHWWHTTVSVTDHQRISVTSMNQLSPFPFTSGYTLLTCVTWLCHTLGQCVMVHTVSVPWHPRHGTHCHFISRTLVSVVHSSSRALRHLALCASLLTGGATENFCLHGALQMQYLINWLIDLVFWHRWLSIRMAFSMLGL